MSLTQVADQTRTMVMGLGITMVLLLFGTFLWSSFSQFLTNRNPPPPPQPNYGFGSLPEIIFPESNANDYSFQLETVGRQVPSIDQFYMPVFFITNVKPSGFFLPDQARQKASALGFILEPQQLGDTLYRWNKTTPIPAVLNLDIGNNRFDMTVSWETDPGFLSHTARPTPEQATNEIKAELRRAGFLPDDLDNGRVETKLLMYQGGQFLEAPSLSETQFIQVDLFRRSIEFGNMSYPIVSSDPTRGLARGLVSSVRDRGKRIVSLEYYHETIDYDNFQTYPYISGPEAWELLNNGHGFVASPPSDGSSTAVVRRVSVAFFDPLDDSQRYLQPIYVFSGDNDFTAYVPALHPIGLETNISDEFLD